MAASIPNSERLSMGGVLFQSMKKGNNGVVLLELETRTDCLILEAQRVKRANLRGIPSCRKQGSSEN